MDLFSMEELAGLTQEQEGPFVSIYLPTEKKGPETRQNPIRFKKLLRESEILLEEMKGHENKKDLEDLLQPLRRLATDRLFWRNQSHGLAAFLSQGLFRTYRLPVEFEDLVIVSDRFHLKPLLPLLTADSRFYLLAVSQGSTRVFQCTRYLIQQLEPEGLPRNLYEALRFDKEQRSLQFRTGTPSFQNAPARGQGPGPGRRAALFHGHGTASDADKERIQRYFQMIDKGLQEVLDENAPLVFAGVDYLFAIYQKVNTHPHLLQGFIRGNPDDLKEKELHAGAMELLEPLFQKEIQEAVHKYNDLKGTGMTSDDPEYLIRESIRGRIDTLMVALSEQIWGRYDGKTDEIIIHREKQAGDQDLLDLIAFHTLKNSGKVYAVQAHLLPGDTTAAAVFRF